MVTWILQGMPMFLTGPVKTGQEEVTVEEYGLLLQGNISG